MENGWRSGGGLWWRPTRQGIAGRRLIKTMGLGAKPETASPRHSVQSHIGLIDLPMPQKTHNKNFCLLRRFGATAVAPLAANGN